VCDHGGDVLESFASKTRDKGATLKFIKQTMKMLWQIQGGRDGCMRAYGAAMKEVGTDNCQEIGRWLNNRAENSHLPFRRRERTMLRFEE